MPLFHMVCGPACGHPPLFKRAGRRKMIDRDRPRIRRLRLKMRAKVRAFLKEQAPVVIAQVIAAKTALNKSAADDIRAILDSLDFGAWNALIAELAPLLEAIVREGGDAALAQFPLIGDVERMLTLVNEFAVRYGQEQSSKLITQIAESTREMIRRDVAAALERGDSNDVLAATLRRGYAFSRERAEVIARTETAYADVEGNLEAYRQSGVVQRKEWITGDGCCDLCDELDGVVVDLEDDFPNEGGSGPPLHPNCRCDVLPVLIED